MAETFWLIRWVILMLPRTLTVLVGRGRSYSNARSKCRCRSRGQDRSRRSFATLCHSIQCNCARPFVDCQLYHRMEQQCWAMGAYSPARSSIKLMPVLRQGWTTSRYLVTMSRSRMSCTSMGLLSCLTKAYVPSFGYLDRSILIYWLDLEQHHRASNRDV